MFLRFLIILLRLRGNFRKTRSLHPTEISSLLVVELTRLGDVITMLPSVRLLARHFPNARVHLLVDAQYQLFLRSIGLPCEVHGIIRPESVSGFLQAVAFVRTLRVDLALSMSPPKRNAAVTLTSGAPRKAGYLTYVHSLAPYLVSTPVESFGCSLTQSVFYARHNIEERSLNVCRALGISTNGLSRRIDISEILHNAKRSSLLSERRIPDRQFIVLHPFSGWEFRSWSIERYNQLAGAILLHLDYDIMFLCEKTEEKRLEASRLQFHKRSNVHFFASDDLLATTVILKEASLVVCNDSGPLHLASALGALVIGLFGPAAPELTAPRSVEGTFLYKHVDCSPCDQCTCIRPTDSCMNLISPEEVFQNVKRLLSVERAARAVANA